MPTRAPSLLALAAAAWLLAPASTSAQLRRTTGGVMTPPVPIAAPADALAVELDPAALAFLPSWSAVFVHADAASSARLEDRGDAVWLAAPLPFGLAIGASAQSVRPTEASGRLARGLGTIALAFGAGPRWGLGASLRILGGQDVRVDGVVSADLAAAWRPVPWLAMSAQLRDVTSPSLGYGSGTVPRSLLWAVALRPFGTHHLTLDLAAAVDADGRVAGRAALEALVPFVGRAHVAAEAEHLGDADEDVRVLAGLAVDYGWVGGGGGVVVGDGLDPRPGWWVSARVEGAARPGVPIPRRVLDLELAGLSARSLLRTLTTLDRAASDGRVAGVLLRMRGSGLGLAYAQELRLAIRRLRDAGKPVVCHLDAATGSELYACAAATRVLLDPAGGVRLVGPSQEVLLVGDLARSLGLRADFVRIGEFKSAPEQLGQRRLSGPSRMADDVLLGDAHGRLLSDLARDWGTSRDRVRRIVDGGPYLAEEARSLRLVSRLEDERTMDDALEEAFGGSYALVDAAPLEVPARWGTPGRIGVVVVDGNIVDGESMDVPFVDVHTSGGATVVEAIDSLAADATVRAIVVRVDSPGGSALASDQIWRAIRRAQRRKPVIASLGAVAASGGYYVASACQEIWADPSTITGSIGIFYGKVDGAELARRIGVGVEVIERGRHAGIESPFRPFDAEERALLADKVREYYRLFLRRVATGRRMRPTAVDAVARGRIWSGDAALARGLVDRLGGFGAALVRARRIADLPTDAPIVVVPRRPEGLVEQLLATGGARAGDDLAALRAPEGRIDVLPERLRRIAAAAYTIASLDPTTPLALLPTLVRPPE